MKFTILAILTTFFLLLISNNSIHGEEYPSQESQKQVDEFFKRFIKPVDNKKKENCLFKKEGPIKITNDKTIHKLVVKTNGESCRDVDFIIHITPENSSPLLYEFKKNLSAISRYRSENITYTEFMNGQFDYLSKPQKHPPEYEKQAPPNEPICKFLVTEKYYKTNIKNKYPIFCHTSYEEGETCIVFIPELGQMIKVAICGL